MNIEKRKIWTVGLLVPIWLLLYLNLQTASNFIVYDLAGFEKGHFSDALAFFIFEVPKVFMLLVLIIFLSGVIRSYFPPEKTRMLLSGKSSAVGNVMAAGLGIVTPFCSCSAIPLFIGFVEAGVPLGVTFSFLIAAPMVNEVALVLLFGMFGWQTAIIYLSTGLSLAILSGFLLGKLNLEPHVQDWVYQIRTGISGNETVKLSLNDRISIGFNSVDEIIKKVWIYIILGIGVGAAAHGYVPQDYMAGLMGKNVWYSVPLSVLIGIPMYSNAAGIVPILSVLIEKGASLGTALAFMMSVIALSLPEIIILKKVLKMRLIFTFAGIVGFGIILIGYLFNYIF